MSSPNGCLQAKTQSMIEKYKIHSPSLGVISLQSFFLNLHLVWHQRYRTTWTMRQILHLEEDCGVETTGFSQSSKHNNRTSCQAAGERHGRNDANHVSSLPKTSISGSSQADEKGAKAGPEPSRAIKVWDLIMGWKQVEQIKPVVYSSD